MMQAGKTLAVVARSLAFSLTIGALALNAGCGESGSSQGSSSPQEVVDYKSKMREMKTAKKADRPSGKRR